MKNFFFSKWPKSFPKVFKLVFNMLRGIFSGKKIGPVHPGGSRSRKISKKWKKIKFSKPRKTFPKVSKFVLSWLFSNFSRPVHPGDQKFEKKSKKFEFLKVSKNVLKSFQTNFELVLRYFSEKNFAQCTLEGRNMEKHQKNGKTFIFFQNAQKRSPKRSNTFWTCFEVVFSVKKFDQCTLDGRNLEKFEKKIEKKLKFQKCPKTFLKVSKQVPNLFWGIFREKFFAQCTLEGRNLEKFKKNGKTFIFLQKAQISSQKGSNAFWTCFEVVFSVNSKKKIDKKLKFQKCPKTILKVSKQVLKLIWGNFFWKKSPSAPWRVETWKNSKKLEKLSIFQIARKNVPKSNQTCFQHA